jgi:hypothetical protein
VASIWCRRDAWSVFLGKPKIKKQIQDAGIDSRKILRSKGKAIPLQAWTRPEGSRSLRLPDFKTIDT